MRKSIGLFGSIGESEFHENRGQRRNGVHRSVLMCLALSGGVSGHAPHEKEGGGATIVWLNRVSTESGEDQPYRLNKLTS